MDDKPIYRTCEHWVDGNCRRFPNWIHRKGGHNCGEHKHIEVAEEQISQCRTCKDQCGVMIDNMCLDCFEEARYDYRPEAAEFDALPIHPESQCNTCAKGPTGCKPWIIHDRKYSLGRPITNCTLYANKVKDSSSEAPAKPEQIHVTYDIHSWREFAQKIIDDWRKLVYGNDETDLDIVLERHMDEFDERSEQDSQHEQDQEDNIWDRVPDEAIEEDEWDIADKQRYKEWAEDQDIRYQHTDEENKVIREDYIIDMVPREPKQDSYEQPYQDICEIAMEQENKIDDLKKELKQVTTDLINLQANYAADLDEPQECMPLENFITEQRTTPETNAQERIDKLTEELKRGQQQLKASSINECEFVEGWIKSEERFKEELNNIDQYICPYDMVHIPLQKARYKIKELTADLETSIKNLKAEERKLYK